MKALLSYYDLKAEPQSYRGVYRVRDGLGNCRILKQLHHGSLRAYLVGRLLEAGRDWPILPDLIKPRAGSYYQWFGGNRYLLISELQGRSADYFNDLDLQAAIKLMAEFHKFGAQLLNTASESWKPLSFNPEEIWSGRQHEMEICRAIAIKRRDSFSRQYLSLWHHFSAQSQRAIAEWLNNRLPERTICHHDWACHNLIIGKEQAALIDFDYMLIDHPVHDRANLIGKYLRLHHFSLKSLLKVLWNFDRFYPWSKGELRILRIYLTFPYDYWILGRQFFIEKQPWSMKYYQDQWLRKIGDYQRRLAVLELLEQLSEAEGY